MERQIPFLPSLTWKQTLHTTETLPIKSTSPGDQFDAKGSREKELQGIHSGGGRRQ